MNCISCGKEGSILLPSLELRTMNVRDMRGHDRYQVPDDEVRTYAVCEDCADAWLRGGGARLAKRLAVFWFILAAGLFLSAFFFKREQVFFILGLAAVFCGTAGLLTALHDRRRETIAYGKYTREEALREAAWQVFLQKAPASMQDGLWRLSYIPVNEKTLGTKPGDLTVIYDIDPAVAKEVMLKLGHPQA